MVDPQSLKTALKKYFGFESFKQQQQDIITDLLDGKDVFVLMPTGGGKSLCYQLPALISKGTAIVISPLIALMKNQVDAIRNVCGDDAVAHFLNSSLSRSAVNKVKNDVREGFTKLLYVAPESLTKIENINFLKEVNISFYAIDEAHCISEWGHDFRPEYRRIREIIEAISRRPVIALTATATPKVQHDIRKNLAITEGVIYKMSFNRPNLFYEVRPKTKDITRDIIRYIKSNSGKSGIVYCLSRKTVEEFTQLLHINNIKAHPYHAGMDPAKRAAYQDDFLQEKVDVIVATIAFGMGIDKPDVRYVIHYDIPKSLEGYYQETGRSGRDGGEGRCIAFYSHNDLKKLEKLMQGKSPAEQEIGRQLLKETERYAESSICRRRILLNYFGEQMDIDNCGNCDNCLNPKKKVEASAELAIVLKAIQQLNENYKAEYIVAFLTGRATDDMRARRHDELECFGALPDVELSFINALIEQAVISGYLRKEMENYGILHLTEVGRKFLLSPHSFMIVEMADFSDADYEGGAVGGAAADPVLFAILKDVRRSIAKRRGKVPHVILQDPALEAMATTYPVTEEEIMNIPGVGQAKAKAFGQEFIDVIKRHVEQNDIIRPTDIKVRVVADKSKVKFQIIQGVDNKKDLEDLAEARGLEFIELIEQLEAIVAAGTRINIDYYINELLDEDDREQILDYFSDTEVDSIEDALDDLSDYTEEEVRLMRIKFLSSW